MLLPKEYMEGFSVFHNINRAFWSALFPQYCIICQQPDETLLCPSCVKILSTPQLHPIAHSYRASAAPFSEQMQMIIHQLKYEHATRLAHPLAVALNDALNLLPQRPDAIIPVPLHTRRQRERGYNQSELLATHLSQLSGIPVATCLKRKRYTTPQVELNAQQRLNNVRNAFVCADTPALNGKHLTLLDDVYTTGATTSACVDALSALRPASVSILTLANAG